MFLLSALFLTITSVHASTFSCERLPEQYTPYLFCSGVVLYDFFLPDGTSVADLDSQARGLAAYANTLFPSSCLSDMKKLICASIYNPCAPGVVDGNFSTYQDGALTPSGTAVPLPFQRPCRSLCVATTYLGDSCAGRLEAFGAATDCDMNNSLLLDIPTFDSSNDPTVCNDLGYAAGVSVVAEPSEPYIGSVCSGLVEEYYVPPSNTIDPNFAPLLPPFVAQTVMEYGIAALEQAIPRFLESECLTSQRKYICSLAFMKPFRSEDLLGIIGNAIYLPSYPHQDICASYVDDCGYLIGLVPELGMDCAAQVNGAPLFPETTSTILSLDLGGGYILDLNSPANKLNSSTAVAYGIGSQCPYSLAAPTDPSKSSIIMIDGTGCALKCPSAAYSDEEYATIFDSTMITDWVCLLICCVSYLNIYKTDPKKRNIFLVLQVGLVALYYGSRGMFLASSYGSYFGTDAKTGDEVVVNEMLCSTNASPRTVEEFGEFAKSTSCVTFAIAQLLIEFISYWFCLALVAETWCKVVLGAKDVTFHRKIYGGGGAVATLGLILLNLFYAESSVAPDSGLWCVWQAQDAETTFYIKALPYILIYSCFVLMSAHIFYTCIVISTATKTNLSTIWKTFKVLFLIILLLVVYYPTGLAWGFIFYGKINYDKVVASYTDWMVCQIVNFVGDSPSEQQALMGVCGAYPSERVPMAFFMTLLGTAYFASVMLLLITLNKDVMTYYGDLFRYYGIDGFTDGIYNFIFMPIYFIGVHMINMIPGVAELASKVQDRRASLELGKHRDSLASTGGDAATPTPTYGSNISGAGDHHVVEIEVQALKPSEMLTANKYEVVSAEV